MNCALVLRGRPLTTPDQGHAASAWLLLPVVMPEANQLVWRRWPAECSVDVTVRAVFVVAVGVPAIWTAV